MATCERIYDSYDDPCGRCSACRANEASEMAWEQKRRSEDQGTQLDRIEEKLDRLLELAGDPA